VDDLGLPDVVSDQDEHDVDGGDHGEDPDEFPE
jgi:hypothetical protein